MSDRTGRGTQSEKSNIQWPSARNGRPAGGSRHAAGAGPRQLARRLAVPLALALAAALGAAGSAAEAADAARPHSYSPPAAAKVLSASAFSFARTVLRADVPVIVAFWAPWCIVCRELDAPLAELAAKLGSRARVVRVNVDWSSRVARRYDVQSLPTVLVFVSGEMVSRSVGGASEQDLEELLAARLAPVPASEPMRVAAVAGR